MCFSCVCVLFELNELFPCLFVFSSLNSLVKFMVALLNSVSWSYLGNSLGKHIYRTGSFEREDASLIFHIVVIMSMRFGYEDFFVSFEFVVKKADLRRKET